MFKNIKKLIAIISLLPIFSSYGLTPISYEDRLYYSREEFAQDDEGKMLFKIKILGLKTSAKSKNMPKPTNPDSTSVSKIFTSGIGGEGSISFFFTNNLGVEMSLGMIYIRSHNKALHSIAANYNGEPPGKSKRIYLFPLTATAIYSIAPYGGIQPYVGVGGHASYVRSKISNTAIKHGFGPVLQAGIDLVAKDYSLINLDIKQYMFSPRITYKRPLVDSNFSSKIKLNPIVISLGLGLKF